MNNSSKGASVSFKYQVMERTNLYCECAIEKIYLFCHNIFFWFDISEIFLLVIQPDFQMDLVTFRNQQIANYKKENLQCDQMTKKSLINVYQN